MRLLSTWVAGTYVVVFAGCDSRATPTPAEEPQDLVVEFGDFGEFGEVSLTPGPQSHAPEGTGQPNLTATPEGDLLLTWIEPEGDGDAVRVATVHGEGLGDPSTVRFSTDLFVNWADFPSAVGMTDGTVAVHWLEKTADLPYAYHVFVALSHDDGMTWSEPIRVHDDASPTEHGFVSMVPWREGAGVLWLDGQAMLPTTRNGEHGPMSLRFRTLSPAGELGPEITVDDRTCECCQTSLVPFAGGLVAAWRDRSLEEIRNIAVARGSGEYWTAPEPLADDGWMIPGCPVNGPQLATHEDSMLAAAWFTGAGGEPQVYAAFSTDGGESFGPRIRVDEGLPLGRVDIATLDDGSAIVAWLETSGNAPRIQLRRVRPDGVLDDPVTVSETGGARSSGFPRIVRDGDALWVAWTQLGAGGGVRFRLVTIGA